MTTNNNQMAPVEQYLADHVPHAESIRFSGSDFLARSRALAAAMGDPQEKCKVVHIAGTSGKGSTAFMIARLLEASGQKVGLFTSPHLTHVRERIVIDGEMISEEVFIRFFPDVMAVAEEVEKEECGKPTYFELLTVLAYHVFAQEGCDYVVMETGLGGRFDATNIVQGSDKIAVITPIGMDHTKVLGDTIEKIAGEKAEIIHSGNMVFAAPQNAIARDVIQRKGEACGTQVKHLRKNDVHDIVVTQRGTEFSVGHSSVQENYAIGLIGLHQAYNAALAIDVVSAIGRRDHFALCDVSDALLHESFPGRMEIRTANDKIVIFDGAHNPQKMTALVETFTKLYPHEKCAVVFAAKGKKDYHTMLTLLGPITEHLIITQFGESGQDDHSTSADVEEIRRAAEKIGYAHLTIEASPELAMAEARKKDNKKILVTGSLYLVGKMREIIN